jgi:hypothetical protein
MLELESLKITYIWFSVEFIPKTQVKLEQSSKNFRHAFDMRRRKQWDFSDIYLLSNEPFYFYPISFYGEEKIDCFITRNLKFTDKCYTKPGNLHTTIVFRQSHIKIANAEIIRYVLIGSLATIYLFG